MRIRAVHLASLLLLLATLGVADACGPRDGAAARCTAYMAVLLGQTQEAGVVAATVVVPVQHAPELRSAERAALSTRWTMRPPAAQAASLRASTTSAA